MIAGPTKQTKSHIGTTENERGIMRDLEFRCWSYNSSTMQDWGELKKHGDFYRLLDMSDKYPMMQYTGSKDSNGVKIFEGDITKHSKGYIWTIVFEDAESRFALKCKSPLFRPLFRDRACNLEVIGNIYENPELLNQATKTH